MRVVWAYTDWTKEGNFDIKRYPLEEYALVESALSWMYYAPEYERVFYADQIVYDYFKSNNYLNLWDRVEIVDFEKELKDIQKYLQELSNQYVDFSKLEYHYLLLQSGSFGSNQIWIENNRWKNNSFRSYWLPTETSNRRSPVNPMMPMPSTLYNRVKDIVEYLGGNINAMNMKTVAIINTP